MTRILRIAMLIVGAAGCSTPAPREAAAPAQPKSARISVDGATNAGVSIAAAGDRDFVTWAATVETGTNFYAAVSGDGGLTFGAPVRVNDVEGDARVAGEQPPRVALGDEIVVAWVSRLTGTSRVRLAKSSDGGRTFAPATTAHSEGLAGARGWQSIAIDRDNLVHAAWLDGRESAKAAAANPSPAASPPAAGGSHAMHKSTRQDIYHSVWRRDGTQVEARVATDVCFCCKTSVATAPDGAAYVAFRHIYPVNLRDMAVARSTDGGRTFGAPVRVSEDHWQINACPEDGPSIAVGADGTLHIAWPTIIENASAMRKAIFYSYSTDRGQTFAPRLRVDANDDASRTAAHPQLAFVGSRVVIVWDESGTSGRRVRASEITSTAPGSWSPTIGSPIDVSGDDPAVYPAVAAASGVPVVAWAVNSGTSSEIRVRRGVR
jgi:hypothetical protein